MISHHRIVQNWSDALKLSTKGNCELTLRGLKFFDGLISMETPAHGLTIAEQRQPRHVMGPMLERLASYK